MPCETSYKVYSLKRHAYYIDEGDCIMLEIVIGCTLLVHVVWVQYTLRRVRKDLLLIAKNPRQARNQILQRREYKSLEG